MSKPSVRNARDGGEISVHQSYCRACSNSCPTLVKVSGGRVREVSGDPSNALWEGFTCIKGRAQPAFHDHPERLLHPLKRQPDGSFSRIDIEVALDEIATRLQDLIDRHGPRSVACFTGTQIFLTTLGHPFFLALFRGLGSKMVFSPNTIDKPGKSLALALHGAWGAPLQGYHDPEVALLLGTNPLRSYYGVPSGNPGHWIQNHLNAGRELIVIDPRRTDVAKRATLHLRPQPGYDPAILAALIGVILSEDLGDADFIAENARGLEELRHAVSPFTPERVGAAANVAPEDLREVARRFARANRGYAVCGVGPGFSKSSTLLEYLVLVLETLTGHWLREGEQVARTSTLARSGPYRAQAFDPTPAWGLGEVFRFSGLTQTTAGMPSGVLAQEMLLEGEGRIRALFSAGANPVISLPDQATTVEALRSLELLVQFDPWMSATSREAHYIIPPPMSYEVPAMTTLMDLMITMPTYYGPDEAWAQYTEALVEPPPDSQVTTEWEFIYGLAQRMNIPLRLGRAMIDMEHKPSADELLETLAAKARVTLAEIKTHPGGQVFPDPPEVVLPKEPGWAGRFDLANPNMLADLAAEIPELQGSVTDSRYPFRLISIRMQQQNNSTLNDAATNRGRFHNPAYMHPADMARLGLTTGDAVRVSSERAHILSIVEEDEALLPGLVAMAYGFGGPPERDSEFREIGSSPGRLLTWHETSDRYVGMPRINNVPVRIDRNDETSSD